MARQLALQRNRNNSKVFWSKADCKALLVLLIIWCLILVYRFTIRGVEITSRLGRNYPRVGLVNEKIDPNTASVASLRRLPMIGPAKANQIVSYRQKHQGEKQPVFSCPEDLQKVRGIGPEIVKRISRYLRFPPRQGNLTTVRDGCYEP